MNSIGKKAMRFLFVVAALLSCKACAVYFFNAERNFKCPICILLKGINVKPSPSYDFVELVSLKMKSDSLHSSQYKLKQCTKHFSRLDFIEAEDLFFDRYLKYIYSTKVLFYNSNSKLYLLFKQLKIGDVNFINIV